MNTKILSKIEFEKYITTLVLVAIAVYGLHYHLAKTLMHLAAVLSLVNIAIAILKNEGDRISTPDNIKIFMGLLSLSAVAVGLYASFNDDRVSIRFFKDFSLTAIYIVIICPSLKVNYISLKNFQGTILLSCTLMALVGIYDSLINNVARTSGSINLPIIYATNLAVLTTASLIVIVNNLVKKQLLISFFAILAFTLGIIGISLSGSRGPLIAVFLVATLIMIIVGFNSFSKTKSIIISMILLALATLVINELPIGKRIKAGVINASSENHNTSIGIRFQLWQAGLKTLVEKPLLGTGIANHNEFFKEKLKSDSKFIHSSAMNFIHLHNDILNIVVWMGVFFGGLFFAYIIYSCYIFSKNCKDNFYGALGLTACITFLSCGLTNTPSMRAASLTLFLLILVIAHHAIASKCQKVA